MALEGKVAAILNERELVINLGSEAGMKEGMKFRVMAPEMQILDPESNEYLGAFAREKIRVKIVDVQPKYAVGSTFETYKVNIGGALTGISDMLVRSREVTRVRTLRADNNSFLEPMDEDKSFVNIGDPVFQIENDI